MKAGGRGHRVAAVALAVVLTACGADDADTSTSDASAPRSSAPPASESDPTAPPAVDEVTEDFVDTSRPTAAGVETPPRPERTITTRVVFPADGGPYPLLVMSHGASGHPDEYAEQLPRWAAEGFVVAAPAFPLTNATVPGARENFGDVVNQTGDVSFVIDQVLAAGQDPEHPLHGRVDPEAIGVVGHSLGGATTWNVAFNPAHRDDRIDSVTVFAGLALELAPGELAFEHSLPLLVLHGDADDVPVSMELPAWERASAPKWFVTLHGADHRLAFTDEPSPWDDLVTRTIVDFWHGTLDGDDAALDRVTEDATDPDLATVRTE